MESIAASVLFDGSDPSRLSRCMCFCPEASFICPSSLAPAIAQRAHSSPPASKKVHAAARDSALRLSRGGAPFVV